MFLNLNQKILNLKSCSDGDKHQEEWEKYILRSVNHEMYLQEVKKSTLSIFDDKRCYIKILKVYHGSK